MRLEDGDAENILSQRPEQTQETYIAEHTMKPDDTLSHLALKYYGSAVREKWMIIYEANKAAIGSDPGKVKPGTVIKIPKLPDA